MVSEIRIYFEGHKELRRGFHAFLAEVIEGARSHRCRVQLVACKARAHHFREVANSQHPLAWNVLLIDSEGPPPNQVPDTFYMVQIMESWFLADVDCLKRFYGEDFRTSSLPGNPHVEAITKRDVLNALKHATKETPKGEYHKTVHAPDLLGGLDTSRVRAAAPNCDRLFRLLHDELV